MPLGPGGLDSNGIWLYGEDDSEALASDLLNLGMQSVSDAIGGGLGAVLQVVSTIKTDTFTTTSLSFTDVTGLSASITPSSASSKILVIATIDAHGTPGTNSGLTRLMRDATPIAISDSAGSRRQTTSTVTSNADTSDFTSVTYLDSPATTSAITYKWQVENNVSGQTVYVNRTLTDTDSTQYGRAVSSITVMEVAG